MSALFVNRGVLGKGWIIQLPVDGICEVLRVNDCRAVCRPFRTKIRTVTPRFGEKVSFGAPSDSFGISPVSSVDVLARSRESFLGLPEPTKLDRLRAQRDALLEQLRTL